MLADTDLQEPMRREAGDTKKHEKILIKIAWNIV